MNIGSIAWPVRIAKQSETIVEKLKGAGVEAKLVVKPGSGHGWLSMVRDMDAFADWFDAHLKAAK
jgi:dipeptidyl aminopeptidase/acylaminoacyl peptidase